jgi:hypothetical protein
MTTKPEKPRRCPNAKKAAGRLRFKGEKEYKCSMACAICRGRGMTLDCPGCEGCGLHLGQLCPNCRGCGRVPEHDKGRPVQAPLS